MVDNNCKKEEKKKTNMKTESRFRRGTKKREANDGCHLLCIQNSITWMNAHDERALNILPNISKSNEISIRIENELLTKLKMQLA